MKPRVSRLAIVGASLLGILVTFIYGFVTMLFFSAKRIPGWVDVFIMLPLQILCPACYVAWHSGSDFWFPASPLINAALYGLVTYVYLRARLSRKEKAVNGGKAI
jgi:hypothetical protein